MISDFLFKDPQPFPCREPDAATPPRDRQSRRRPLAEANAKKERGQTSSGPA